MIRQFLPVLLLPMMAFAAPKERPSDPIEPPVQVEPTSRAKSLKLSKTEEPPRITADPNVRGIVEYSGDPIDVVLRMLARKAKMNVVVAPSVVREMPGGVNLRLEDKTHREVIEVICQSGGLIMTEKAGVYYINSKFDKDTIEVKDFARRQKLRLDAFVAEGFTRAEAMQFLLNGSAEQKVSTTGKTKGQ